MTVRNLDKALDPGSVAVIGSVDMAGSPASVVLRNVVEGGFEGPVWPVVAGRGEVMGLPCFDAVDRLPGAPGLAVLALPAAEVPEAILALGAKGGRIAVVLGSALEFGGGLRQRMLDAARVHMVRVIGPETLGVLLPGAKLNASFAHRSAGPGKVALLTQSASIATTLIDWAADNAVGFSSVIALGDMADVDVADCLDLLSTDFGTRAILLYLVQVGDARKFLSAARAVARMKPVIVLKPGRTPQGRRAVESHAGVAVSPDAVFDAALRRAGVLRVRGLSEMLAAVETVARFRPLERARLAIVSNAGGAGALAVDRLMEGSGQLAELAPETLAALDQMLPAAWSNGNPVDILGDADGERYVAALEALGKDRGADVLMALNCPSAMASSTETARALTGRLTRGTLGRKPVLTCWLGGATAREGADVLRQAGIASYATPAAAAAAVGHLTDWGRAQAGLLSVPDRSVEEALRSTPADARERVAAIFAAVAAEGRSRLTEPEAKAAIAAYAVPVPEIRRAASVAEVAAVAGEMLEAWPRVVVKLVSRTVQHKSDVGGVVLNVETVRQAEEAARGIAERAACADPPAELDGFAVEPMIQRPEARELILGVGADPVFGPTILFGSGGLDVEVVSDTAVALPPLDASLAADLIAHTRVGRLLAGYRGTAPADPAALQGALISLSHMIEDFPCLRALDVNPLIADAEGVLALDAGIEIDPNDMGRARPNPDLSIRPYPSEWRRDVPLKGGSFEIRPVRPADALLYPEFLARLSPEDIRMRFMAPRHHFPEEMTLKFTQLDYDRDMAFVAIAEDGSMAGVSRMSTEPSGKSAEYALLVRTDMQGRGLGSTLMRQLADYARAAGVEVLEGIILSENRGMLRLVEGLGFRNHPDPDESGVMQSRLALQD